MWEEVAIMPQPMIAIFMGNALRFCIFYLARGPFGIIFSHCP
jgi:hypothetical protein